mmetsp:Transcript_12952/g.11472  ORF Transcript_12952/g.11472 Transcript_12952/m.11472 type:complete len:110 (+) Transcript_12952:20-349(+)
MYFTFFSYLYLINIVINVINCQTLIDFPISMLLDVLLIAYFPYTCYGPNFWMDGYTKEVFLMYYAIIFFSAIILVLQYYKGSRFMLSMKFRKMTYEAYQRILIPLVLGI